MLSILRHKSWHFLRVNLLLDFFSEVDEVVGVWARDLGWFVRGLVDTLLAILIVEAHVIPFESRRAQLCLTDFLDVLNFAEGAQSAWVQELKLGIVV